MKNLDFKMEAYLKPNYKQHPYYILHQRIHIEMVTDKKLRRLLFLQSGSGCSVEKFIKLVGVWESHST